MRIKTLGILALCALGWVAVRQLVLKNRGGAEDHHLLDPHSGSSSLVHDDHDHPVHGVPHGGGEPQLRRGHDVLRGGAARVAAAAQPRPATASRAPREAGRAAVKRREVLKDPATAVAARVAAVAARVAAVAARETAAPTVETGSVHLLVEEAVGGARHTVRVLLRPDLSASSAAFMREAAARRCGGRLYRAEAGLLLQGRISCTSPLKARVAKGDCPPGVKRDPKRKCFAHDPNCGCHGPVMTKGMVGWAGGATGPDFFVYTGAQPNTWWSHDHTILGIVEADDAASWAALAALGRLPVANKGGMAMLKEPCKVTVAA